jgi:hypothetical protein
MSEIYPMRCNDNVAGAHRLDGLGPKAQLRNARRNGDSVRGSTDYRGLRVGLRRWRNGLVVASEIWRTYWPLRAFSRMRAGWARISIVARSTGRIQKCKTNPLHRSHRACDTRHTTHAVAHSMGSMKCCSYGAGAAVASLVCKCPAPVLCGI